MVLQGFMMMMVVIKIATDVTGSSQPFLDLYHFPFSGKDIDQKQYEIKALFVKEVCWSLILIHTAGLKQRITDSRQMLRFQNHYLF